jgi:hypothetical protein
MVGQLQHHLQGPNRAQLLAAVECAERGGHWMLPSVVAMLRSWSTLVVQETLPEKVVATVLQ